jgi:hypothetical protein
LLRLQEQQEASFARSLNLAKSYRARQPSGSPAVSGGLIANWVCKQLGIGVEMFGQIGDLANTGSFKRSGPQHGPTLFYNPSGDDDGGRR